LRCLLHCTTLHWKNKRIRKLEIIARQLRNDNVEARRASTKIFYVLWRILFIEISGWAISSAFRLLKLERRSESNWTSHLFWFISHRASYRSKVSASVFLIRADNCQSKKIILLRRQRYSTSTFVHQMSIFVVHFAILCRRNAQWWYTMANMITRRMQSALRAVRS